MCVFSNKKFDCHEFSLSAPTFLKYKVVADCASLAMFGKMTHRPLGVENASAIRCSCLLDAQDLERRMRLLWKLRLNVSRMRLRRSATSRDRIHVPKSRLARCSICGNKFLQQTVCCEKLFPNKLHSTIPKSAALSYDYWEPLDAAHKVEADDAPSICPF